VPLNQAVMSSFTWMQAMWMMAAAASALAAAVLNLPIREARPIATTAVA
jgi:hypothetical protein